MEKEKFQFSNFQLKNKNTINNMQIKELFIKKKDIYLLKLLKKKQNKLELSVKKTKNDFLPIKNALYSPLKLHILNAELPGIGKKFSKYKQRINNAYLKTTNETENNKNNKDNRDNRDNKAVNNFENDINKTSHRKVLEDKNTSTTSITDNKNNTLKLSKEENNKLSTQKKSKKDYERITLKNYSQKRKTNFSYDKYFIEYIENKDKFYNPDKTTKKINYQNLKFNSFNHTKNNANLSFIQNTINSKENDSFVVIPCKRINHINVFNDLIYNEFESKKQNSNTIHNSCYNTNIFDRNNYGNNSLNIYRKKFNKNIKIDCNISTLTNELTLGHFYNKSSRKQNKIRLDKKKKINISLEGISNIVKQFYGFNTKIA